MNFQSCSSQGSKKVSRVWVRAQREKDSKLLGCQVSSVSVLGTGSRRTPQRDPGSDHIPRCLHRDRPQLPGPCRHCWGPAGDSLGPVMVRASTWWRQQRTGGRGEPARVTSHCWVPQPPSPGGSELGPQPHATTLLHEQCRFSVPVWPSRAQLHLPLQAQPAFSHPRADVPWEEEIPILQTQHCLHRTKTAQSHQTREEQSAQAQLA